jgi:glycosyltransferase involved in cell wall biosynthesis
MRILYLTQYYVTPDQPGSLRHYAHTGFLQSQGHDVVVITTYVLHKQTEIPSEYRNVLEVVRRVGGVKVRKVYSRPTFEGFRGRLANYLSFMVYAVRAGRREAGTFDVVYASSPPLFVGVAGWWLSRSKRARFILEVRDLWPESAVALGFLRNRLVIWMARRLERWLYARARRVVCATEGIAAAVRRTAGDADKVYVIKNGVDSELFEGANSEACSELRSGDEPSIALAMYAGAHGVNNGLDLLIEAARLLGDEPDVRIVLVGHGDQTPSLKKRVEELGLSNVRFLGLRPRREIPSLLRCADVLLWPGMQEAPSHRLVEIKKGAVPNKLFDYLAARKPIVTTIPSDGEAAVLLGRYGTASFVAPSGEGIAEGVRDLIRAGNAAGVSDETYRSFLSDFARSVQARKLLEMLTDLTGTQPSGGAGLRRVD